MCNFMGYKISVEQFIVLMEIEKQFGTAAAIYELERMKDGFKYGNSAVLRKSAPNDFEIVSMHWEFIPPWIRDMEELKTARKQGIPWLNATSEKLLESKMFRNAALKRRCLVLATHFFDWRHYKPEGASKDIAYPYVVQRKDEERFFMAGIWQTWTDKSTGETMDTFAIVTTRGNSLMSQVHNKKNRMPTILTDELAWEWMMNDDLSEDRIKEIASFQLPAKLIKAHSIRKDFKLIDDPMEPCVYAELPQLSEL